MDRTVYQAHFEYTSQADLQGVEEYMKVEELRELNRKSREILESMGWDSVEQKALAEKVFRLGYLAAHVRPGEPQKW